MAKNKGGRPSLYSDEILKKTKDYLNDWEAIGHRVPSIAGLSDVLGHCIKTIQNWSKQEGKEEFLRTLELIKSKQHFQLINKGLGKEIDSGLTKLMLHNFGYSDKQEVKSENKHYHGEIDYDRLSDDELDEIIKEGESS